MLRLWPEQITIGLFPGRCWLRRRGNSIELPRTDHDGIASLTAAFEAALTKAAPLRGARLDVIVSDRSARICVLPWQATLKGRPQWQAYALAAFDASGMPLDEDWVCTSATRFGEQGLALALPASWIALLEEAARRHGAHLRTVMPLSAAAYWSPRRWMPSRGLAWILLEDEGHASLLCFDGRRSIAYDTQPALDERGLRQLLQRHLLTGAPARVAVWRADGASGAGILKTLAPDASVHDLPRDYWDRHA